jgi:hypothetical protein
MAPLLRATPTCWIYTSTRNFDEGQDNRFGSLEDLRVTLPRVRSATNRVIYLIRTNDDKRPVSLPVGLKAQFSFEWIATG